MIQSLKALLALVVDEFVQDLDTVSFLMLSCMTLGYRICFLFFFFFCAVEVVASASAMQSGVVPTSRIIGVDAASGGSKGGLGAPAPPKSS